MARPGLQKHPKFRRLVVLLGVPVPHALGYLECLWEVAYEHGNPDIGDALDVELAAQWPGERGKLCDALATCGGTGRAGFIEQTEDGRYQVHDLFDHCPDYVHRRHAKESERQLDKTCEECGTPFRSTEPHARFCKDACRYAFNRKKHAAHARARTDTHADTHAHEPPAPAPARAPAPAPTGETPVLPFAPPPADPIETDALTLAQELAFADRQGTSPSAIRLALPHMLTLLRAGVSTAAIRTEINRPGRHLGEHPGAIAKRLLPPEAAHATTDRYDAQRRYIDETG